MPSSVRVGETGQLAGGMQSRPQSSGHPALFATQVQETVEPPESVEHLPRLINVGHMGNFESYVPSGFGENVHAA